MMSKSLFHMHENLIIVKNGFKVKQAKQTSQCWYFKNNPHISFVLTLYYACQECLAQHERDMELSFAVAGSQDRQCGICMDTVLEKEPASERRFGILSDCTHCFCLACIRKWRASKQFDNKTIR